MFFIPNYQYDIYSKKARPHIGQALLECSGFILLHRIHY